MTRIIETKDATLSLENRVAVLSLERDDVRNALTGTALTADLGLATAKPLEFGRVIVSEVVLA